jgi:hypothetical protein
MTTCGEGTPDELEIHRAARPLRVRPSPSANHMKQGARHAPERGRVGLTRIVSELGKISFSAVGLTSNLTARTLAGFGGIRRSNSIGREMDRLLLSAAR